MLEKYRDWSPTPFDTKGHSGIQRKDWLVAPVIQTRDSGCMERSNYLAMLQELKELSPNERDFEDHRFGHWGPGWFEIIIVRPLSPCHYAAMKAFEDLQDYPILNEDLLSEIEWDEACETWGNMSTGERIEVIKSTRCGASIFAARYDDLPQDDSGSLYEYLIQP